MFSATQARGMMFGPLAVLTILAAGCMGEPDALSPSKANPEGLSPLMWSGDGSCTPDAGCSRGVMVCKVSGPEGEYTFNVSATGGILPKGDMVTLAVGQCAFVWVAASPDDPEAQVTVQEVNIPAGVKVASIYYELDTAPPGMDPLTGVDKVTIPASWTYAGEIYFRNEAGPPPEPCSQCDGGVSALTLRNDGPAGTVEVRKKGGPILFSGWVDSGAEFSFQGADKDGKMGADIEVRVDGTLNTTIHVSCSRPIGPGLVSGSFTVIAGASVKGGALCPIEPTPDGSCDYCSADVKPRALTMTYTGDSCAATSNSQAPDKVKCEGDAAGTDPVHITVMAGKDKVLFDGVVPLNGSFTLDAANVGEARLHADTDVTILDAAGNVLQTVRFHTSCSQPLMEGDRFGSLMLTGFTPEH